MKTPKPWLQARLKEIGKKQSALAAYMRLPDSRVSEMISGKREISVEEVGRIAKFLQMEPTQLFVSLTGGRARHRLTQPQLEVRGRVQAGDWRVAWEWPQEDRRLEHAAVPDAFSECQVFGLEVAGDSMNEVYPPGAVIWCVPIDNYPMRILTGNKVVVQRTNRRGEFEATVKEYVEDGPRKWLIARSTNPIHRAPIYLDGSETEEARILAIVVGYHVTEINPRV